MLKGLLLKESLNNLDILDALRVTKTETWNIRNTAIGQPSVWTAISFEADESQADSLAEKLSQAIKPKGWFINASTDKSVYVVFPKKVFKYGKGDEEQQVAARQYGQMLDIPEQQLDWSE
jgi:hypothetical protein